MPKKHRRFHFQNVVDALLLLLALAALGTALLRGLKKEAVVENVVPPTLVFTQWWQRELNEGVLESLIKDYERIHPEIRIRLDWRSYEELEAAVLGPGTLVFGDIVTLDPLWAPTLVENGRIEAGEAGEPGSDPSAALVKFFQPFFYNIDLLKAAGFSRPPKTWSEFLAQCKAVKALEPSRYGLILAAGDRQGVYLGLGAWIWAAGATMSAGPQRRLTETLTFISGLNQEAYLYPGAFNLDKQGRLEAFAGGQAAFMVGSVEDIDTLRRRMGEAAFSVSSVPTPDTYADKPVFGLAEWSLGVSSQGLYQEEARQFASFLAAQASRLAEQAHAAPGATDSFYEKVWDLYAESDLVQEPPVLASRPGLETGLRSILSGLFAGLLSPDEAAKALGDPL